MKAQSVLPITLLFSLMTTLLIGLIFVLLFRDDIFYEYRTQVLSSEQSVNDLYQLGWVLTGTTEGEQTLGHFRRPKHFYEDPPHIHRKAEIAEQELAADDSQLRKIIEFETSLKERKREPSRPEKSGLEFELSQGGMTMEELEEMFRERDLRR